MEGTEIDEAKTEINDPSQTTARAGKGRIYWFIRNLGKRIYQFYHRNRFYFVTCLLLLIASLFYSRAYIQPYALLLRRYIYLIVLGLPFFGFIYWQFRKRGVRRKLYIVFSGALVVALVYLSRGVHDYLELYVRYHSLQRIDLSSLPLSDNERIQPRNSIYSLAHEVMSESESPMVPDFVRTDKDEYRWTMAIEPAYPISRILSGVKELYSVAATTPSPSFARENRISVEFQVGEHLKYGRNSTISVIRSFGLWRFLNYEPSDVTYVPDDKGKWVQVVSLIRWKGILFPHPEFGGVQIIRPERDTILNSIKRAFVGTGEWVKPKDISSIGFLRGQNILPYTVSRHIAHSFRFQNGFLAPLPFYHVGDIRIPDMIVDVNNQPFTAYFVLPGDTEGSLFHYFALEPFDPSKQGLNTSLFLPADGTANVYVYRHHDRSGSLTGVSAISAKVMESKKNYDWSRNRPVEHRPFIRDILGTRRFFWLTTVVTLKEGSKDQRFIAGTVPDVVITDAAYSTPVWVNPLSPNSWLEQVQSTLDDVWGGSSNK